MKQPPTHTPASEAQPFTAMIVARNEAAHIERAVQSVRGLAAEVLVVDTGSSDDTKALAAAAGARVVSHEWLGYGATKNWAAQQAAHPWILSLDADEQPDEQLTQALRNLPLDDTQLVYGLARITQFCGHWVRHGAWRNDVVWRVYHRDAAHWDERPVHESLVTKQGEAPRRQSLAGLLRHYSYPTLASHDAKAEAYLALSVESLAEAGVRATYTKQHLAPVWRAFKDYVLQQGWRDGWAGREIVRRDYRMVKEKYRRLAALQGQSPTV